jgi:hypothetical protein
MAGRKLAGYVHVGGMLYGPDDDVPADVAKKITNPKAWEGGTAASPAEEAVDGAAAPAKKSAAKKAPSSKTEQ